MTIRYILQQLEESVNDMHDLDEIPRDAIGLVQQAVNILEDMDVDKDAAYYSIFDSCHEPDEPDEIEVEYIPEWV